MSCYKGYLIEVIADRFESLKSIRCHAGGFNCIYLYSNGTYMADIYFGENIEACVPVDARVANGIPIYKKEFVLYYSDIVDIDDFIGLILCKRFNYG